jgi:CHAT domain-containing protein
MDEQRLQAYQQLIQQLLSCPDGEKAAILQANTELLDADFLLMVVEVAAMFTQKGEENTANWLMVLASQLSEALDIPLDGNTPASETPVNEADIETYRQFLLEVLQATAESQGNPQVVYPLLAANTDKLNLNFAQLLQDQATKKIAEAKADKEKILAEVIVDFSNLIREFPLGNQADNIEIAITGYEIALTIFTRHTYQEQWATLQHNLGYAYYDRIEGDKPDNLEKAKKHCERALEVRTHSKFRREWANTKNILGNVYVQITQGDEAQNLEDAITCYLDAREVFNCHEFRIDWARIQNLLGNAYRRRIKGDIPDNFEQSIKRYKLALEVRTRCEFTREWATSQNGLGSTYLDRIKGEKPDNLEQAIKCYKAALEEITNSDFREDLAMIQHNIAVAYTDKAEFAKINEDKFNYAEEAIKYCELALEIRTYCDFPKDWAMTQNVLGDAYRIKNNLKEAIECHKLALKLYDSNSFPFDYSDTLLKLGIAYQNSQQLDLAYDTFKSAIANVEDLRGEIISGAESKRKHAEKWNQLYRRMVEVCLALDKETEAIIYIERSKTRNLVEQILSRDLKTIFPAEIVTQLEELRDEIATGQNILQTGKTEDAKSLREHLQKSRKQRQQLQDKYLPIGSSFEFASLENIVDNKTAIIEWYILTDKIIAFVIQPGGKEITIWQSSSEDREALRDWINEYLTDYYNQKDQWQNQLEESLQNLAVILHIEEILQKIPPQCQKLILIPHQFLHLLPLHALPVRNSYLMDLFPQGVGYAPSLQVLQQVQLRQRPNFQSLFAIQNPTENLVGADLEIESIKQYFPPQKITLLCGKEADRNALNSRIANLAEANCLHFSCHGSFNLETPADSCLLLNGADVDEEIDLNKCLTLGDLFNKEFNLNQCRLVVLSACETGMIDFNNVSDEYIGLPSGFLYAGSSSVVSSLWKVDDVSTAFLFIKFYENLQNYPELKQGDIAIALNEALIWLRNMTSEEGEEVLQEIQPYIDVMFKEKKDILKTSFLNGAKRRIKSNPQPFANPFHWAAFTAIGY